MPGTSQPGGSLRSATFVLVPGAGGQGAYWHRVQAALRQRGHHSVAVDLPAADATAGLQAYADVIEDAAAPHPQVVLVAQSMGGFSAPLVCTRRPIALLVLVNAMIPLPGETAGAWWGATGQASAYAEQAAADGRSVSQDIDLLVDFFHDVPPDVTAEAMRHPAAQSDRSFADPFPLDGWPAVATRVLVGRDDRLFPAAFQRRVAEERLGITPEAMPGGHLLALSRPDELAERLIGCWADLLQPATAG